MIANLIPKSNPKCGFLSFPFSIPAPALPPKQCKWMQNSSNKNGLKRRADPFFFCVLLRTLHIVAPIVSFMSAAQQPGWGHALFGWWGSWEVKCLVQHSRERQLNQAWGLSHSEGHPGTIRWQIQGERTSLLKEQKDGKNLDGKLNSEDLVTFMLLVRQGNSACVWNHFY